MVKTQCSFQVLMRKAVALGQAKLSGDKEAIRIAQEDHDTYKAICLQADELSLGLTNGQVHDTMYNRSK